MQNKYEVIGIVGEGAYGVVYKCKNKETKEYVAIKRFKETKDDIVKKTMRRELAMLKLLKHENVVDFLDCFKNKGNLYLVFEYVERTLLELLEEKPGGLHPSLIKKLMFQLCKAIKYLHDQNIIHRDIKPENLLINNQMQLKLCDFGFARKITMKANENLTDYVATRWYRSPELLITNGYYGTEVDYWAIGCIMGELADGNPLFPGENETDQLHCIQKVLGNLPQEQVNVFYKNPLYIGKRLLDVDKPETLKKRYMGKLPKIAIDFMEGLLELDPKKRLNGNNVFSHPYFQGMENNNNTNNSNVTSVKNSVIMTPYKHKIALSVEDKGSEKQMQQQHVHFNTNSNREYKDKVNNNSTTMNNNNTFTKFNNSSNKNNQTTYNTTNINIINYNYNNSESNNTHNQHKNIFKKILFNTNPNNKTPSHNNNNNNNIHNISNSIILTTPKVGMMTLGNNFPINSNNKNNILKYITTPSNNQHSQKHEMSSSLTSFVHFNKSKYNSPPIISISPTHTNYNGKNKTFFVDNKGNYGSNPYPKPLRTSENNNNVIYEDAEFLNDNKYKNKYIFHGSNKKYFGYNNNNTKYSNGHNNGIMSYYNGGINTKGYFGGGNNKFQLPSLGTMYKGNYNHLYNNHHLLKYILDHS